MFRTNFADSACLRCGKIVYPTDKIGPLKDYAFFHSGCFRCIECGSKLTLKTYFNNQHCQDDKEVYCSTHVPKIGPGKFDGESMGIKTALNVPKSHTVNEQIRPGGKATFDAESLAIKIAKMHVPSGKTQIQQVTSVASTNITNGNHARHKWGRFDTSALHIQHALKATEVQRKYSKPQEKSIETYLDREEQVELENIHREEEDRLYIQFQEQRKKEESEISNVIEEEWEVKLGELTAKFEKELNRKKNKEDHKLLTVRHMKEKAEFEKHMTIKREKKKESVARKLLEQERAATAELVDRHSEEMMTLIQEKKMEKLGEDERVEDPEESRSHYPAHPPPPMPPTFSKAEIYKDPTIFAEVDQRAISVAQEDQKTFTDLVRQLVAGCDSDVEKARSIFRWITVKNLNSIMFEESERGDTPMGLLRGIKFGTESYHVLFKRLCSYAGLHCVVIKGFSKSAGYQPGISFEDNRFRNSWNAVFVAGSWRFVQCNWGARHLVNAKEVPKPGRGKSDSLRYEYDDHYFLTDSKEFIYEFFPLQTQWQLLKEIITLEHFEELPFVRSLFFRYRLGFPSNHMKSVMHTDSTGAATVRLEIPKSMEGSLIFHYNIKFYSDDKDNFDGTSLKRYVMQSVIGNIVAFRVHAPCNGSLLLDIFANAVTPQEYLTGEPMKFKSVCKFKIMCAELQTVMVPLPDCASGEWGPAKAMRLFGLEPLSHKDALVFSGLSLDIKFAMTRPLTDFMATLHKNGFEEKKLNKVVSHKIDKDGIVTISINLPEEGQYGMDIYTREVDGSDDNEKHLLTHCCKYLINASRKNK
ncbi:hillarin [Lepeophtheirus salmonis]|nr:hillarin-like [Lepeophtheirus salmonis]